MRDLNADAALEHLSLNTATVRKQGDLLEIFDTAQRSGITCFSPWRDQVEAVGLERVVRRVRDGGLRLSGYCRGGMFPADGTRAAEVRDDNRRAVDEAAALGAPCLVLVVGGLPQYARPGSAPSKDIAGARAQVEDGIGDLLDYAETAGVPLAIEPLHPMYAADRACVNTMGQALDICDRLDPFGTRPLGLAVDVYHVWWDPDVHTQIARAGFRRLMAFHICDWLVPTRDLLLDRGMMGDGAIDIPRLRAAVEAEGFAAPCEVEIFSDDWWSKPMTEVLDTVIERYRTVS
ncbi:MAG TPA: sugar phosphate isomerase/epimerase family protein [Methylomirabilota bacterium]|nr:sugar phosphate isomerase/epimerase family protein [Methylomirabilota bacterium]